MGQKLRGAQLAFVVSLVVPAFFLSCSLADCLGTDSLAPCNYKKRQQSQNCLSRRRCGRPRTGTSPY